MRKTVAQISFLSLSSAFLISAAGCVAAPPPYEEYTLARSAVRAAQDVDSARFASGLWNKAEENYRNGEKAFKDADYDQARRYFVAAQGFAERAENATRLKKFQTGESFP